MTSRQEDNEEYRTATPLYGTPQVVLPLVHRTRLVDALTEATKGPLTVLVAPPGSGKTTALIDWIMSGDRPKLGLWLTVDQCTARESFWEHLALSCRASHQFPPTSLFMRMSSIDDRHGSLRQELLLAFAEAPGPYLLILDDAQNLTDDIVNDLIWLARNTRNLHLVAATTNHGRLDSAATRVLLGTHTIDVTTLRMTRAEIVELFNQMGAQVTESRITQVEALTTGLPLLVRASIVFAGPPFDYALAGAPTEGSVVGTSVLSFYLETVLDRLQNDAVQPTGLSTFLLNTSLAEFFDARLAAELAPGTAVDAILAMLEERGFGAWQQIDGQRVFQVTTSLRNALLNRLLQHQDVAIVAMQRAITRWALDNNHPDMAVWHVGAARDAVLILRVVTSNYFTFTRYYKGRTISMIESLPERNRNQHPEMLILLALTYNTQVATKAKAVDLMREIIANRTVILKNRKGPLTPWIDAAMLGIYRVVGLYEKSTTFALRNYAALMDPQRPALVWNDVADGVLISQIGVSLLYGGRLDDVLSVTQLFNILSGTPQSIRHEKWAGYGTIAYVHALRGNMNEAKEWLAKADSPDSPLGWQDSYVATPYRLAHALVAINERRLGDARAHIRTLDTTRSTTEHWPLIAHVEALVAICDNKAFAGLHAIERDIAFHAPQPSLSSFAETLVYSARAQLALAAHDIPLAEKSLSHTQNRGMAPMTAAFVRLMYGDAAGALADLGGINWDEGALPFVRLHALTGHAVISVQMGLIDQAVADIDRALALSRTTGYRIAFYTMPGKALRTALKAWIHTHPATTPYIRPEDIPDNENLNPTTIPKLTGRERTTLAALQQTGSIEELAAMLFVSPNTVKSHLRSLYRKLQASNREEALLHADELGLIRSDSSEGGHS